MKRGPELLLGSLVAKLGSLVAKKRLPEVNASGNSPLPRRIKVAVPVYGNALALILMSEGGDSLSEVLTALC